MLIRIGRFIIDCGLIINGHEMVGRIMISIQKQKVFSAIRGAILIASMVVTIYSSIICVPFEAEGKNGNFGGGTGASNDPYIIDDVFDLQAINDELNAQYALANDIDAGDTKNWNEGAGFQPLGESEDIAFTGALNGRGYTINGLYVNGGSSDPVGFFGCIGTGGEVKNINLVDLNVTGIEDYIGGLVGYNSGLVENSYAIGTVTGTGDFVGGLIGRNGGGTVENSYTMGSVTGYEYVGGLIGQNHGSVINSGSTGNVTGSHFIGGLVGENYENLVKYSYATGQVSGEILVGGLVGYNHGSVSNSYATGSVFGNRKVGGLVGYNQDSLSNSYATGDVTGNEYVGGLVGDLSGSVTNSYYNKDHALINGGHYVTIGGLYNEQYQEWINNGMTLDISDYDATLIPSGNHYEISNVEGIRDLLGFSGIESYNFYLVSEIDLSQAPGLYIPYFSAVFHGNDNTISNLNIVQDFSSYVGMFGYNAGGSVSNLDLNNVDVTGYEYVGELVGRNDQGFVSNSYTSGSVSGYDYIGGLVGYNENGTVSKSCARGTVSGHSYVGGLIGENNKGSVSKSYALTSVSGSGNFVGGLVGDNNYATVSNSFATGMVSSSENYVGGLVGDNFHSEVIYSYATGSVTGSYRVGGLVGLNDYDSLVWGSYATGSVVGIEMVGGLVGSNDDSSVTNSYATGSVVGQDYFGGLMGGEYQTSVEYCFWDMETSGKSTSYGGEGKTTAGMKNLSTFSELSWDIISVTNRDNPNPEHSWNIVDKETYPFLSWEGNSLGNTPSLPFYQRILSWVTSRDTYNFINPGSQWSKGGNCYGISSTEILYYNRYILNHKDAPYYPMQHPQTTNTNDLTVPDSWIIDRNPLNDDHNNVSLAITIHQLFDPACITNLITDWPFVNLKLEFGKVNVSISNGRPTILILGPNDMHAVVVYGVEVYHDKTIKLFISDPNKPNDTTYAYYYQNNDSFLYNPGYGFEWHKFIMRTPGVMQNDWFFHWWWPVEWFRTWKESSVEGYTYVIGNKDLIVETLDGNVIQFITRGDSQTLQSGIPGSAGITEGEIVIFAIPEGITFTVDPILTNPSFIYLHTVRNTTGTKKSYAYLLNLSSTTSYEYNVLVEDMSKGIRFEPSNSEINIDFSVLHVDSYGQHYTFNNRAIPFNSGDTIEFLVKNWTWLSSFSKPSIVQNLYRSDEMQPYKTYNLTNNKSGLESDDGSKEELGSRYWLEFLVLSTILIILSGIIVSFHNEKIVQDSRTFQPANTLPHPPLKSSSTSQTDQKDTTSQPKSDPNIYQFCPYCNQVIRESWLTCPNCKLSLINEYSLKSNRRIEKGDDISLISAEKDASQRLSERTDPMLDTNQLLNNQTELIGSLDNKIFCSHCGKGHWKTDHFCSNCGKALRTEG